MAMAPHRHPALAHRTPAVDPLRLWPVFTAYGLAFGMMIAVGVVLLVVVIARQGLPEETADLGAMLMTPTLLIGSVAASCTVLAAAALVAGRLSPVPLLSRLRLRPARGGLGGAVGTTLIATLGGLSVGQAFESTTVLLRIEVQSSLIMLADAARDMSWGPFLLLLLVGSFGAGVGEEMFFRGYMQTRLAKRWGRWRGIAVTAAAFGLLHFDVLHTPAALLMGLYLGWVAELRGSILVPIAMHILNNVVSFSMFRVPVENYNSLSLHRLLLALSLLILPVTIVLLRRLHLADLRRTRA